MAVQERLGGLGRISLDEAAVAVGQVQHKVMHLLLHAADHRHRLPEIALGMTWRMGQRHEHLLGPPSVRPHVVLDYRVLTAEPVLVPQSLKDTLGRMALLPGNPGIAFQDGVNHAGEGLKLRSPWRALASVTGWNRIGQHLAHRVPVQAEHPGGFPNAHPLRQAGAANTRVQLHLVHPFHPPKAAEQPNGGWQTVRFSSATSRRWSRPRGPIYRRRLQGSRRRTHSPVQPGPYDPTNVDSTLASV